MTDNELRTMREYYKSLDEDYSRAMRSQQEQESIFWRGISEQKAKEAIDINAYYRGQQ